MNFLSWIRDTVLGGDGPTKERLDETRELISAKRTLTKASEESVGQPAVRRRVHLSRNVLEEALLYDRLEAQRRDEEC